MTFETGKLAKLADGAVTVRCGDTIVLVTAVSATKIKDGQDWFPLSVEYKEKAAAAGKFPGGYFKREGRPTEKEILTCRMTDRPLRPLFPKGYLYDTQIVALLLSADGENDSDILAMNGASAALCVSDIPFAGPIGAVRVGRVDGQFVVNPTHDAARRQRPRPRLRRQQDRRHHDRRRRPTNCPKTSSSRPSHFAQDAVVKTSSPPRKNSPPTRRQGQARHTHSLSSRRTCSKSPTKSPATASKPPSTRRAKSSAPRKSAPSATKWKPPSRPSSPKPTDFDVSQAFDYLQKKAFRISILDKRRPLRRPRHRRPPPALRRSRHPAPRPRLRPLRPRRNPGPRPRHPRSADEAQDIRQLRRRRRREALHPALQLPSLLRRRNRPHRWHEPPRNRPRRARRALHRAGHP